MRVSAKLRAAFAVYLVLLVAVLAFEMRAIRRGVASGHELTAAAARLRINTSVQTQRLNEMTSSAGKFAVTRDVGYRDRVAELSSAFGDELRAFGALRLTEDERERFEDVAIRWRVVEATLRRARADSASPDAASAEMSALEPQLDLVQIETVRLAEASRAAMAHQLSRSELEAREAERVAWAVAGAALLLGALLSFLLVRAIVRPLRRLADGTRAIAAGRFGFRLPTSGRDELAQVAADFNAMGERLAQLDAMKREFVSNVSHDLKTPLSSMQETTQALLDQLPGPITDKQRRLLHLNHESGRRLSAMIAKLLELARLESGAGPASHFEIVDLVRVARGAVERAGASARTVLVILDEPVAQVELRADGDGIGRVLDNLLENAIRFSPEGGTVHLSLAADAGSAVLTVKDEGPGIPETERERVFERFYQTADGRAARAHGVGLGLAICRHIVTAHGGSIAAEGNSPRGTVLRVTLPGVLAATPRREAQATFYAASFA